MRGNVHIGAAPVAKSAHYQRFSRRGAPTPCDYVARSRWGATVPAPMCTLGLCPSRGLGRGRDGPAGNVHIGGCPLAGFLGGCDNRGPNVHIRVLLVAGTRRGRDGCCGNVHIGADLVAQGAGPATDPGGVRTQARRMLRQCAHWRRPRRGIRTLPAVLSRRGAHSLRLRRAFLSGRDGFATDVHIGLDSVARCVGRRDGSSPNVHIRAPPVAGPR